MEITLNCTCKISLEKPTLAEILSAFSVFLTDIIGKMIYQVLLSFTEQELLKSSFSCEKCTGTHFCWKTKNARETSILTEFGKISFNDLQIYCTCCGKRKVVARELLEIGSRTRIPAQTVRKLALVGALTTFGVSKKIAAIFGVVLNKMTVWRCVQKIGKEIEFSLDPDEKGAGEADGTGIPTCGVKKRGRELKVFLQLKKGGGVRIANLSLGRYNSGWNKLFKPLRTQFKAFEKFILVTDGDDSILKGLGKKVDVIFQRCLWHIPHQFKWYRWRDGLKHTNVLWRQAMVHLVDICDISRLRLDDESLLADMIELKKKQFEDLIFYCRNQGWNASVKYLENAKPDLFRGVENRLMNRTQSHAERVMRTVKMRTGFGKWKEESVLNCVKVRLAHYYNGWKA